MSKILVNELAHTNATSAFTVDTAGRLSIPNQPMFQVVGNNNNYVNTATVPFPTVQIDTAVVLMPLHIFIQYQKQENGSLQVILESCG